MIKTFKSTGNGLELMAQPVEGAWVHVVDPGPEEVKRLACDFDIPPEFIAYPLDVDEMPRTERENGTTLIVVRVPYFAGEGADIPYITLPLGIILAGKSVITVCRHDEGVLHDFYAGRRKGLSTGKRNRFVLQVLWSIANHYLVYLREINRAVDALEDRLQRSLQNRELQALLKYQKSLVYFTTALKSNELMMERLQKSHLFQTYPDDQDLLEDVLTENQQAIEMTAISSNILSSMMDAFASIISNNLNVVMKFLASVTVILTIPTMIASFYGMNVGLPLERSPMAFLLILLLAAACAGGVGYVFWKKDWL